MSAKEEYEFVHQNVAFPVSEYKSRIEKLRRRMTSADLDAIMVFQRESRFYLTGSQSDGGFSFVLIPLNEDPCLLCWGDSEIPLAQYTSWLPAEDILGWGTDDDPVKVALEIVEKRGLEGKKIGLEGLTPGHRFSPEQYNRLKKGLGHSGDTKLVMMQRNLKTPMEVEYIRIAARMTDKGMLAALNAVRSGVTENDVARAAICALCDAGSEAFNMPQVNKMGIPHQPWRRRPLRKGDAILLEMSGVYNRYYSPMMRTAFIGEPTKRALEIFDGCLEAMNIICETLAPGKTFDEVAKEGMKGINKISKPYIFHKWFGYSIGFGFTGWADDGSLYITEGDERVLKPGMTFHSTMSVRDVGLYGIALSEVSLITEKGSEQMGKLEKKLFVTENYID